MLQIMKGQKREMARFHVRFKDLLLRKSAEEGRLITQKEVAEATGLSLPTISRWYHNDVKRIEVDTVTKLSVYFGCTFNQLVGYDPEDGEQ